KPNRLKIILVLVFAAPIIISNSCLAQFVPYESRLRKEPDLWIKPPSIVCDNPLMNRLALLRIYAFSPLVLAVDNPAENNVTGLLVTSTIMLISVIYLLLSVLDVHS